jgi:transcriptional regulator with XRE-family HTH domain
MARHEKDVKSDVRAMNKVGDRIAQARLCLGWSQEELGARMEPPKGQGAIARWETGKHSPSVDNLLAIARALGVDPAELLPGAGGAAEQAALLLPLVRQKVAELAELLAPTPAASDLEDQIDVLRRVRTDDSGGGRRSGPTQTPLDESSGGG